MYNKKVYEKKLSALIEKYNKSFDKETIKKQLDNLIKKKVYIASSYDNHWLVIVNDLQIARVQHFEQIKTSDMKGEQLEEWKTLNGIELDFLKREIDRKNKVYNINQI